MTELFRGPQGERGPKGERGLQGDRGAQGEAHLAATAEELVRRLIKAKAMPKWFGYSQAGIIAVLTAVIIVLAVWVIPDIRSNARSNAQYTNSAVQHECSALELITRTPVPPPASPSQNPSRAENYKFYEAVLLWEHEDGCKT